MEERCCGANPQSGMRPPDCPGWGSFVSQRSWERTDGWFLPQRDTTTLGAGCRLARRTRLARMRFSPRLRRHRGTVTGAAFAVPQAEHVDAVSLRRAQLVSESDLSELGFHGFVSCPRAVGQPRTHNALNGHGAVFIGLVVKERAAPLGPVGPCGAAMSELSAYRYCKSIGMPIFF